MINFALAVNACIFFAVGQPIISVICLIVMMNGWCRVKS